MTAPADLRALALSLRAQGRLDEAIAVLDPLIDDPYAATLVEAVGVPHFAVGVAWGVKDA